MCIPTEYFAPSRGFRHVLLLDKQQAALLVSSAVGPEEGLARSEKLCPPPPPSRLLSQPPGVEVAPQCLWHLPLTRHERCEGVPRQPRRQILGLPPGAPPDAATAPLRPFRFPRRRRRRFRAGDGETAGAAAARGREGAQEPPPSWGRALRHCHLALVNFIGG